MSASRYMVTRTLQFRCAVSVAVARCRRGIIRIVSRRIVNSASTVLFEEKLDPFPLFFIFLHHPGIGAPGMDHSHPIGRPLRETDVNYAERNQTNNPVTDFRLRRVRFVDELDRVGIGENADGLAKSDAVASLVANGLPLVPLEDHRTLYPHMCVFVQIVPLLVTSDRKGVPRQDVPTVPTHISYHPFG